MTPEANASTPMPPPNEISFSDAHPWASASHGDIGHRDSSVILSNRSLTDMLACTNEQSDQLQNQVELLLLEIEKLKKVDNNKKLEIKKLTNENDKWKRDASRKSGINKYTDNQTSALKERTFYEYHFPGSNSV